ncbi:hypothetical protein QTI33_06805 [Variovorax sp. J22P271]|uniref:hypothetical protein n=1 Tax=Variovorax davisae TaxID=3053515 RepID=UPI002576C13C|nr:hypothetical protein [Variovorax sp. J22P271]MDM0031853.1 hypothetical protein [Variovorax sp. J22P271]
MQHFTIRSVEDLSQLSGDELSACLRGLRRFILATRRKHATALRDGLIAAGTRPDFSSFNWFPKRALQLDCLSRLGLDMPIDEIAIGAQARQALRERGIYWLEDLCAASERELQQEKAIDAPTLSALRDALASIGLGFRPDADTQGPQADQCRVVLALHREARRRALRGLEDDAHAAALGLRPKTLERVLDQGCETLGQLRRLSLDQLRQDFGRRECREIYMVLAATQRPFASAASEVELWRCGLLDAKELSQPTDDRTPTAEFQPWLGRTPEPARSAA